MIIEDGRRLGTYPSVLCTLSTDIQLQLLLCDFEEHPLHQVLCTQQAQPEKNESKSDIPHMKPPPTTPPLGTTATTTTNRVHMIRTFDLSVPQRCPMCRPNWSINMHNLLLVLTNRYLIFIDTGPVSFYSSPPPPLPFRLLLARSPPTPISYSFLPLLHVCVSTTPESGSARTSALSYHTSIGNISDALSLDSDIICSTRADQGRAGGEGEGERMTLWPGLYRLPQARGPSPRSFFFLFFFPFFLFYLSGCGGGGDTAQVQ